MTPHPDRARLERAIATIEPVHALAAEIGDAACVAAIDRVLKAVRAELAALGEDGNG